jgi:hypothetical protein
MLIVPASIGLFGDGFPSTTTTASVIKSALMFDGTADYLKLTPSTAGSTSKATYSFWVKRSGVGDAELDIVNCETDTGTQRDGISFGDGSTADLLSVRFNDANDGHIKTNALFRDPTAWQHWVVAIDTGQSTAADRVKIYANGTQITSFATASYPSQGYVMQGFMQDDKSFIGTTVNENGYYFDGYLAEFIGIDGIQLAASAFGTNDSNGVWGPKDPSDAENIADWGGKNSFWLKFDDGNNIGKNSRPTTVSTVDGSYKIDKSLMLNAASSQYLSRTPHSAGNRRTWTFSAWVKRGQINTLSGVHLFGADRTGGYGDRITFGNGDTDDRFNVTFNDAGSGRLQTKAYFRDPTAWTHFVIAVDTTQSTASERVKIFINGVLLRSNDLETASYPAEDYDTAVNNTAAQMVGARGGSASQFMDGYLADVILLDGTAVSDASDFGGWDTNGNWVPVDPATKVAASAGTNGFHLKFDASGLLGKSSISSTNPSVSHLGSSTNGSTSTAYTFSSSSLGAAASNRTIVIAVGGGRATAGTRTVSTLTVGGSSATFIARKNSGAGNVLEFWSIAVASGTSADIVVTFSASMVTAGISWWRVLDAGNPISTDGNTASGWTTQAVTTIGQTGDVAFYAIYDEGNADAYAWSDATERSEHIDILSTRSFTSADYTFDAAESHAETATISGGSGNDNGFLGVTFSNNNSFASNSLAAANQVTDSPTNTAADNEGNYPVWNLAHSSIDHSTSVIDSVTEGNLRATVTSNNSSTIFSTMASPASGKYMIRFVNKDASNNSNILVGLQDTSQAMPAYNSSAGIASSGQRSVVYRFSGGYLYINGTNSHQYTTGASADNTLDLAWDAATGKVWIAVNGTWQDGEGNTGGGSTDIDGAGTGNVATLTSGYQYAIACSMWDTTSVFIDQDGGTLPTDFKRFNTANFPAPTVTDPRAHYATALYTGTAQSKTVRSCFDSTGTAWTPDWVWVKCRSDAGEHVLVDSVRGAANVLTPDHEAAEFVDVKAVTSLIEGGFTLGNGDDRNDSNDSAKTYVAWCMKAGGAPTVENDNTSSAMDDGSVFKSGVVQTSYTPSGSPSNYPQKMSIASHGGFSIVKYTGTGANATVPHGLSTTPTMVMVKPLTQAHSWAGYHSAYGTGSGNDKVFRWDTDHQGGDQAGAAWQNNPFANAHTITFGSQTGQNENNTPHIMYTWARTPGMIGIGSYAANADADGTTVVIDDGASGFRPAWLMVKNIVTGSRYWVMLDSARNTFNPTQNALITNETLAEATGYLVDFTANGFKIRVGGGTQLNTGTDTHIYLAFADQPFNLARAK